ncbi:nuclear transport factor 2 family protein [Actinokineospora globicatena]|uniref:nuclear transport factor 2 family protein n=1 Tax=Actinokineospora globicatena TaxID=103729 RepID=UPI002555698E|nr:nuclear transport factor 2 family protein [Actinokineospora globicatena]
MTDSLRAAERRLQAAQLTSDTAALEVLLDDGLRFTGPDGAVLTKQDDLAAHAGGHLALTRVEEEDLEVLAVGDAGVTWFLGVVEGTVGGQALAVRMRYTRTWIRGESGWKVVAAHASVVG